MSIPELDPDDAYPKLDRFRIIDVREESEFHGPLGRIRGATLIPLGELAKRIGSIPRDRPLLVVCRSGKRSLRGCEEFSAAGVSSASNLAGGMIAWNRHALPVEHTEPESLVALRDQIVSWLVQVGPLSREAAIDQVRRRFEPLGLSYDAPTHPSIDLLLVFTERCLSETNPPDLELCLAFFRRALAAL